MTVLKFPTPGAQSAIADLLTKLIGYVDGIHELRSPNDVLNELHALTAPGLPLSVLGAARFPSKSGDWASVQLRNRSSFTRVFRRAGGRNTMLSLKTNSVRCCSYRRPA